jgi:MinD superfamily P-loop ATPase
LKLRPRLRLRMRMRMRVRRKNLIVFRTDVCDHCGACVSVCPRDAIVLYEREIHLIRERCDGCRSCLAVCPVRAVEGSR